MFLNLKDFAGTSPHTPSLTCDAAGAGGRRKKRAPYHLPLQQSVFFWRGGKGYPKRFIKTIKPSLQIFLDVSPLPWHKLLKPGGAAPARLHGILCGSKKGGNAQARARSMYLSRSAMVHAFSKLNANCLLESSTVIVNVTGAGHCAES
ncbi:putative gluconolactonase domain protein [Neisseria meningitidis NM586]|nr:putative gluconolactonase domain protein [Neisseria meningitidis NM586]